MFLDLSEERAPLRSGVEEAHSCPDRASLGCRGAGRAGARSIRLSTRTQSPDSKGTENFACISLSSLLGHSPRCKALNGGAYSDFVTHQRRFGFKRCRQIPKFAQLVAYPSGFRNKDIIIGLSQDGKAYFLAPSANRIRPVRAADSQFRKSFLAASSTFRSNR